MKARTAFRIAALLPLAAAPGCTCAKDTAPVTDLGADAALDAAGAATGSADASSALAATPDAASLITGDVRFSLPIAAGREDAVARTYVAGLRVPEKAITVARIDDASKQYFAVDVLTGVSWSQDAELHVYGTPGGAWVVWRGVIDGKRTAKARHVSATGALSSIEDVGAANCAGGRALHWVGEGALLSREPAGAPTSMKFRGDSSDVSILCAGTRPLLMQDTEEGTSLLVAGDGGLTRVNAFDGESEGRTTLLFGGAKRAGVLRIGERDVVVRALAGDKLEPAKTTRIPLKEEDDVVAAETAGASPVIFFTREAPDNACDGGASASASVAAFPLVDSDAGPSTLEIAPFACERERGPFWSSGLGDTALVAWVERERQERARDGGRSMTPPIAGVSFARVLASGALGERGFVAAPADGIVDAGCDDKDCYAAVLVREPGHDDSKPEAIKILRLVKP